jgi:hypothetical protein
MNEEKETKKVVASMILEAVGKPSEYLVETLENISQKISEEKGIKILNKKINKPIEFSENKNFFTTFAEIEVESEDVLYLILLIFKYMPSHIEVIEPEKISLTNNNWNDILNEVARRLHGYDDVARILQNEKVILENKLREIIEKPDNKKKNKEKRKVKKNSKKN